MNDSQEEALNVFRKYDRTALPVVDSNGVLVGIVTIDDMLDVAEEEATEDIQKFGGMEALDEPYMRISLWRMVRKRAGWLVILFLGEMLTATAMSNYQDEIAKAVVLAFFLPLIISSGGNSGSQASTLIIRAMALGEVTLRDWWRVASREIQAGLSLGIILGAIGAIRVAAWSVIGHNYFHRQPLRPALAAGCPDRRSCPHRRRSLGIALRFDASVSFAPGRGRSGHFLRALRRDAGRCDRTDYLFQHCLAHHARRNAIAILCSRSENSGTRRKVLRSAGGERAAGGQQRASSGRSAGQAGGGDSPQYLLAFAESRREDKRITQQLTEELSKTFITPLEREDIQALAAALYKIPKDGGKNWGADAD